jgi:threonine aldolase
MANVAAVLAQTRRGEGVLVDEDAHVAVAEGGWLTELAGLERGRPPAIALLENTHTRRGGAVLTAAETAELAGRAPRSHLDGARLANAAVALDVPVADLAAPVDTVSFSLNKGLCAPFGALLAGDAATIAAARGHVRRLGGGSVHKAGLYAAAGLLALDLVERLADDHRRARELARLIGAETPQTNIVWTDAAVEPLRAAGVLALAFDGRTRLVTHREVDDDAVARAAAAVAAARDLSG